MLEIARRDKADKKKIKFDGWRREHKGGSSAQEVSGTSWRGRICLEESCKCGLSKFLLPAFQGSKLVW